MKTIRHTIFSQWYFRTVIGVLAGIFIMFIGSALLTWMVLSGRIHENLIVFGNVATAAVASFSGTVISIGKGETKKLLVALVTGISITVMLLMATALLLGGQYQGILATVIPVFVGSLLASIVSFDRKKHKSKYRFKTRYR